MNLETLEKAKSLETQISSIELELKMIKNYEWVAVAFKGEGSVSQVLQQVAKSCISEIEILVIANLQQTLLRKKAEFEKL